MIGTVYAIRLDGKTVYVGSTKNSLEWRWAKHRSHMAERPELKLYKLMHELGFDHFRIEALGEFTVENKRELLEKEGEYIRLHDTVANGCNHCMAGRDKRQYRIDTRDHILAYDKAYRERKRAEAQAVIVA